MWHKLILSTFIFGLNTTLILNLDKDKFNKHSKYLRFKDVQVNISFLINLSIKIFKNANSKPPPETTQYFV